MNKQVPMTGDEQTPWDVIDRARLGTMRSTGEVVAMILLLEGDRDQACQVLHQVCKAMGISGRELDHIDDQPDVVFEKQWEKWREELEQIRREYKESSR